MAGYPEPLIDQHTFEGGMNSDFADELIPKNMGRVFLNCRVVSSAGGNLGVVTNIMGNVMVTTPLPEGICKTIGAASDERNNKAYFAVYNSNGFHTWYVYDGLLNTVTKAFQSITDSNGIDILRFSPKFPIFHIDIIIGNGSSGDYTLIYWCDGLNKGRKFNLQKALDKTSTGYGIDIFEDFINQYKKCPVYAPVITYATDPTRNSNFLYAQPLFKFCYRYIYDDGEISNYSDWSLVALPPNQSYEGVGAIVIENNFIQVSINSGSRIVVKIEIAMTSGTLPWVTIAILSKVDLGIGDSSNYVFNFYNDGAYAAADQNKINRPNSYMFRIPICQAFVQLAMTQTGGDEGFPSVAVNVSVVNQPVPLFLPPGTVNQYNNPSLTVAQTSYTTQTYLFATVRYVPTILFTIGADVKKGNVFTVTGQNGGGGVLGDIFFASDKKGTDNYIFNYPATAADTAISVANQIKAYLRGLGRGQPDGNNGISGEGTIGGNAFFSYTYLGQYRENITTFHGSVTPVQFAVLTDDGVSIQVIKSGSTRQYAIGYEDDDGRKSPSYTSVSCAIRTPFLTEAPGGILQQPVHAVSVFHQPPLWARYWMLYRTPDEVNFIQVLVQQVIDVKVIAAANPGEYLDLVIGSLATYNAIHTDSILAYQFTKGDRLRFIRNETSGAFYTPFFETTVLSYSEVTTELRNAQISVHGTNLVEPSDGVIADYVGKNIQIDGIERTIIGIHGTSYVLDNIINIGSNIANTIQPNYTFIDRRGIIRIAKPSSLYTIVDYSTVEIYTPQENTDSLNYKNFFDTAQKFDIANFGTATAAHRGTHQDQDGTSAETLLSTPAIVYVTEGDAYIRNRELPTNTNITNTEVLVDAVEDPNFSDFYTSNLNNIGRVFPTDDGSGQKHFGSRTRFSNNFIVDTAINGLNDFDDLDRVDYNDAYGDVMVTKYRELRLYIFKKLKDGWIPVGQTIINTPAGQQIIGTSDKLLGPIQYFSSDAGIGDNPESFFSDENYMYHAAPNIGTFVRVAGDGVDNISTEFGFDFEARTILDSVKKYGLRIPGGKDKTNDECIWSVPEYVAPVYNNPLNQGDWVTTESQVPMGAAPIIVTQPANGVVTYDAPSGNFLINMNANFIGTDTFTYKFDLGGGSFTEIKNGCITVVAAPPVPSAYQGRASSKYCTQILAPVPPAPPGSIGISRNTTVDISTICGASPTTVYISNVYTDIVPGVVVYTDSGMTTLLIGNSYIQDGGGAIYNLDPGTGVVGASTGFAC